MNSEIQIYHGDVIRLKSDKIRCWVCLKYDRLSLEYRKNYLKHFHKHVADNTGIFLFGGYWYNGDALTEKPYGKTSGQLTKGRFNDIAEVLGNIEENSDLLKLV